MERIFKIARITFVDCDGEYHPLIFRLYDSDLVDRWIEITKKNQQNPNSYINCSFTNVSYSQITSVRNKLTECLKRINSVYDEPLPLYEEVSELNTAELNYLHEEFERYGDRQEELEKTDWWTVEMHNDFLELNELIHLHEDVNSSKTAAFPNMAVLYDYYPQGLHESIKDIDRLWLTPELHWGEMYLGYNTLGKDWLKVFLDNDLEVIEREHVRPQERFAAETWINFGPDSDGLHEYHCFEKWYLNLPPEIQKKVPIDNLSKLNFGRFKIGILKTTDDFIRKYGGTRSEWEERSGKLKKDWDDNVFSKFTGIVSIEFNV